MADFSPGPWSTTVDKDGDNFSLLGCDGKPIIGGCGCCGSPWMGSGPDTNKANACLIAAAPDLLEVAPDAVDLLEQYADFVRSDVKADDLDRHPYLPSIEDAVRGLRAAIAKAKGE